VLLQPSCPFTRPVLTGCGQCLNRAPSVHRWVSWLPLRRRSRLLGRTKINGFDPPLRTVRTAYASPPLLAFFHPLVELTSGDQVAICTSTGGPLPGGLRGRSALRRGAKHAHGHPTEGRSHVETLPSSLAGHRARRDSAHPTRSVAATCPGSHRLAVAPQICQAAVDVILALPMNLDPMQHGPPKSVRQVGCRAGNDAPARGRVAAAMRPCSCRAEEALTGAQARTPRLLWLE
jgi:hypothetical protein